MPSSLEDRMKYIQDFAKHGFMDLEESTPFESTFAEALIIISIECHRKIFGQVTPLMVVFWARAVTECPTWTPQLHELHKSLFRAE
jgi:hypothetical protein